MSRLPPAFRIALLLAGPPTGVRFLPAFVGIGFGGCGVGFEHRGRVTVAQRYLRMPSNLRWEITVQPTSTGDITIVLPGGRACDACGAICTLDGRRLTGSVQATVRLARR